MTASFCVVDVRQTNFFEPMKIDVLSTLADPTFFKRAGSIFSLEAFSYF